MSATPCTVWCSESESTVPLSQQSTVEEDSFGVEDVIWIEPGWANNRSILDRRAPEWVSQYGSSSQQRVF